MDRAETINLLKQVPLFSSLSEKGLKAIIKVATEKSFAQGTKIVGEGDLGVGFYLIVTGSAEVVRNDKQLAKLGSGAFFGEMSLLDGAPRSADVIALEDTTCLILTTWVIKGLIAANPDVAMGMLKELSRRLREADRSLS
ncbi:cyclic nucleotide-binding domain-containing protein [Candidatus Bipolaricaulota bacterium]|nr:cyclic nucleotide-binding domain-containing protein [Candidatus Bipolaricaulota bacterium]